ncbi:hypothetical protein J6590_066688 [Homalodisca vitripennis]|nr:hypothetical protein J6590_066688 [Homalodisca vitripennis]
MAGRHVCSYRNCDNSYDKVKDLKMFKFPKNSCREWVKNCGNPDLIGLSPKKLNANKKVCEYHFRKGDILPSGRLIQGAIPICFEPAEEPPRATTSADVMTSPLALAVEPYSPMRHGIRSAVESGRGLRESRVPGRPTQILSLLQYRARTKWQHRARARRSASCHHPCRRRSGRVNFPYGASTLYIPYYSVVAALVN